MNADKKLSLPDTNSVGTIPNINSSSCCCCQPSCCDSVPVKSIYSKWSYKDYLGAILARISNYVRSNYNVEPGMYFLGKPGADSPVFVSANYKLSFDILRRSLFNMDAWILVLDTKGINVWCAAGKGSFGTAELIRRINTEKLSDKVTHRKIIVPQLGAANLKAHEVAKETEFKVIYGPVRARDISGFLKAGNKANREMRTVKFGIVDRLILTPMEFVPGFKYVLSVVAVVLAFHAFSSHGLSIYGAWKESEFMILGIITAYLCGALFTPLLLPVIPFRAFSVKGFIAGLTGAIILFIANPGKTANLYQLLFIVSFMPGLSSFLAFNFTGATTFTNPSGVKCEMKAVIPAYIGLGIISVVALILSAIKYWRN